MPLTFALGQVVPNCKNAAYSNLFITPIIISNITSTGAGNIVLTWSGGLGNNVQYSYALSVSSGVATIVSANTTTSSGTNTTTLTLSTIVSAITTTVTITGKVLDGYGSATSASITIAPFLINSAVTGWTTGADISGTSVYNGITYSVYAFQPILAAGAASKQYCLSYNLTTPTNIYVLAVGGGGGGGSYGGAGGGAGGVVMQSVTLPPSANASTNNNVTVSVGSGGVGTISTSFTTSTGTIGTNGSNTTVSFSANTNLNIVALGGGLGGGGIPTSTGTGFNGGSGTNGFNGGSGGGGCNGYVGTIINGSNISNNNNFGNNGSANAPVNGVAGGGGGAGTMGVSTSTSVAGAGSGGNGIQCFLPGIAAFAPSGTAYGTYYWGGGGGGSGYLNTVIYGNGGLGGGGGGASGNSSVGVTGNGGGSALNNGYAGLSNNNGTSNNGYGGSAGANTGGGGGGGWSGAGGGAGGSGIVIIAFPQTAITSNAQAVLPSTLFSGGKAIDVLSYDTSFNGTKTSLLSAGAYASIKGAFSCKLVNYNYYGPILTLRYSTDTNGYYTQNFYADVSGNLGTQYMGTGQSVKEWLTANGANTTYAYVTKWYSQGMDTSFNSLFGYNIANQPIYDVVNGLINFGYVGSGANYPSGWNQSTLMSTIYTSQNGTGNNSWPIGDASYAYVIRHGNITPSATNAGFLTGGFDGANSGTLFTSVSLYCTSATASASSGYVIDWATNSNGIGAGGSHNYLYASTTAGQYAANNVISTTYVSGSKVRYLYVNGSNSYNDPSPLSSVRNQYGNANFIGTSDSVGFFYGQMYNFYVYQNALTTGSDRAITESTPYQYAALASITGLAASSITATTFALASSAVTNAVNYAIYVNGAYYSTVAAVTNALPSTTVTPGGYGPWQATVYAYNASNVVIALSNVNTLMANIAIYYPLDNDFKNYALTTPTADGQNKGSPSISNTVFKTGYGSALCKSNPSSMVVSSAFTLPTTPTTTTGRCTVAAWFYATSWSSGPILIGITTNGDPNYNSTVDAFEMYVRSDTLTIVGNPLTQSTGASGFTTGYASSNVSAPPLNKWFHLALTVQYNNATSSGTTFAFYLNGVSASQGTGKFFTGGSYMAVFGGANTNNMLDGYVDDCRVYSRVLTANEIVYLATGTNSPVTPITNLTASSITSTGCSLSWSGGQGSNVSYTITYSPAAAGATATATSSPVTITGLAANTAYTITLNAQIAGNAVQSASTTLTTYNAANTVSYGGTLYNNTSLSTTTTAATLATGNGIIYASSVVSNSVTYSVFAFGQTASNYVLTYNAATAKNVSVFAVGGGGGSTYDVGGGGGGGGVVSQVVAVSAGYGTITVSVGAGGAAGIQQASRYPGANTVVTFSGNSTTTITCNGGQPGTQNHYKGNGGSSGGPTAFAGGTGNDVSNFSGGGGGAGGVGQAGTTGVKAGNGGSGVACSSTLYGVKDMTIAGSAVSAYYWGGGGGGAGETSQQSYAGNGGIGGGGGGTLSGVSGGSGGAGINAGGSVTTANGIGGNGGANTGGGGGGGYTIGAGSGGSGIVIIAIPV